MAQALLVAERLAAEPFDHFYSSDLGRALQTSHSRLPTAPAGSRSRSSSCESAAWGVFQGLTAAECQHAYPADYRRFHGRRPRPCDARREEHP